MSLMGTVRDQPGSALHEVHTRLLASDVAAIKNAAEKKGVPWQIELRALVHRAVQEAHLNLIK